MPGPGGVRQAAARSPLAGLLGLAAAVTPGAGVAWYRPGVQAAVFVVVLAVGYGLECAVAARTGHRSLGGAKHAEGH